MKFVILLLAFFIPLLTFTSALKCYKCPDYDAEMKGPDKRGDCSSNSYGLARPCNGSIQDPYCVKSTMNGIINTRGCVSLTNTPLPVHLKIDKLKPGCNTYGRLNICLCNSDLCNGNTKIIGMSLTTLFGGVLALFLIK